MSSAAVEVRPRPRTVLEPLIGGSNRGASAILPFFTAINETSSAIEVRPRVVSPRPDQLARIQQLGASRHLSLVTHEAKIEDVITAEGADASAPLILTLDSPNAIFVALTVAALTNRSILLYVFFQMGRGGLVSLAAILTRHDDQLKRQLAMFFAALGGVTVRTGSAAVFGEDAPAANHDMEEFLRDWIGHHMATNLQKVIVDLEPNTAPIQVSRDGEKAMTFLIEDSRDGFKTVDALRTSVLDNLVLPLERGKDLLVAEVGPEGVRFHDARLRLDGSFDLRTTETNGVPDADRQTASITNPVIVSD